jgi:hypothetical protein
MPLSAKISIGELELPLPKLRLWEKEVDEKINPNSNETKANPCKYHLF